MVTHSVFLDCVPVEIEAEAGTLWQWHLPIRRQLEFFYNQLAPQRRLGQRCWKKLNVGTMRSDGRQMGCSGDADPSFPAVRHDQTATVRSELANAARLGETADSADVRLGDIHFTAVHQV